MEYTLYEVPQSITVHQRHSTTELQTSILGEASVHDMLLTFEYRYCDGLLEHEFRPEICRETM